MVDESEMVFIYADTDSLELTADHARDIARDYASSGTVGSVLAEFGTTGRAEYSALLDDIERTRAWFRKNSATDGSWLYDMDRLEAWADETVRFD